MARSSLSRLEAAEAAALRRTTPEPDAVPAPAEGADERTDADRDAAVVPTRPRYVRIDPIRSTVDLMPAKHAKQAALEDEASLDLGLAPGRRGVTRQMALDALVSLIHRDDNARQRWVKELERIMQDRRTERIDRSRDSDRQ